MKPIFDYIAGTGGVGKGILFNLLGDQNLGRNESRLAVLTDFQDFCKLHIILHYTSKLLRGAAPVYPIGRVGADENGRELLSLMESAGMDTRFMLADAARATMFAVCFQYPDGDGGNLTAANSACDAVCAADIDRFFTSENAQGRGLLLAAPEVPVDTRAHLLRRGKEHGCFNAASLLPGEAAEFLSREIFRDIDLLAINQDEAAAILSAAGEPFVDGQIAEACGSFLRARYPQMSVVVTLGRAGALVCSDAGFTNIPPCVVTPVSTAGAGDCFLGTILACYACGVPLGNAAQLAALSAGVKVQCKDTIHFGIDEGLLLSSSEAWGVDGGVEIRAFLRGE